MAGGARRRYFLNVRLGRYATIRNVNTKPTQKSQNHRLSWTHD
jgi:hypothetical protein